jgi:hypothetical protein
MSFEMTDKSDFHKQEDKIRKLSMTQMLKMETVPDHWG